VSGTAPRSAVILDRDGTIVVDRGYLDDPAQLCFLPGAVAGLRLWHERGHPLIVVSNQSGVGRGRLTLARAEQINESFLHMVEQAGARIDGIYYCPHRPDEDCACRKPKTRLVMEAAEKLGFDPARSIVIGDKSTDIELGRRLGAVTMLVSANGRASDGAWVEPDFVVGDLLEAAQRTEQLPDGARASGRHDPAR
jgi:D-glycero-D-manno-heptose 1,7-bisphosphate phosphatase